MSGRINVFETRIPGRLNYDPEDTLNANIAYVLQDDVLVNMPLVAETDDTYRAAQVATDTVAETLLFAARLKNKGMDEETAKDTVHQVLRSLKLEHIANSSTCQYTHSA